MKKEARRELHNVNVRSIQDLMFLDDLQHLGLGDHFEEEIEEILHQLNKDFLRDTSRHDGDDPFSVSLQFRLLRQGGYPAASGNQQKKNLLNLYKLLSSLQLFFL